MHTQSCHAYLVLLSRLLLIKVAHGPSLIIAQGYQSVQNINQDSMNWATWTGLLKCHQSDSLRLQLHVWRIYTLGTVGQCTQRISSVADDRLLAIALAGLPGCLLVNGPIESAEHCHFAMYQCKLELKSVLRQVVVIAVEGETTLKDTQPNVSI